MDNFLQICLMLEENLLHCPTQKGSVTLMSLSIVSQIFPKPLTDLFDPTAMSLPYPDLLKKCDEVYKDYVVTVDQTKLVESKTQGQASSHL